MLIRRQVQYCLMLFPVQNVHIYYGKVSRYHSSVSADSIDLMTKLMGKDPSERIGGSIVGAEDNKNYAFFDG